MSAVNTIELQLRLRQLARELAELKPEPHPRFYARRRILERELLGIVDTLTSV